jgi:pre-mRNA-splicing factor SYF2
MNHQEVIEEDKRNKLPLNWEARKRKAEWVLNDEEKRREAEEKASIFLS